jgi:hypothetical protein
MAIFQHPLWGYEFTYPDDWAHRSLGDVDGFAARPEALEPGYAGEKSGHLLVKAEWNAALQPVEPLWAQHMGLTAGMMGAKRVGSAPWQMGGAVGLEAEIALPKQTNLRLWSGILARDFIVLHLMVAHPKEEREWFEPLVTRLIASLRFPPTVAGVTTTPAGIPLPPGYTPVDPYRIIADLADPKPWQAFGGQSAVGALQAFYLREAAAQGWAIDEFVPFPLEAELGFARLKLHKGGVIAIVGLMPGTASAGEAKVTSDSEAKVVIKIQVGNPAGERAKE